MQFSPAQLPSSIDTVEELAAWALSALQPSLSKLLVAESVGAIAGPRIDANLFTNQDGELNLVFRASFKLESTALVSDGSLYKKVVPLTSDPLPPGVLA